ncbi:MAG TPA: TetR/AcrR family transcriptional regulator [Herpetosiphonaceae bacterium]
MTQNGAGGDLRVRRTRRLLHAALIELTGEKGFAAVTVGDISERAMVNRATFYRHYQDKYDLVMAVLRDVLSELSGLEHDPLAVPADEPMPALLHLFEHIAGHAAFYRGLVSGESFPLLERPIREYVGQLLGRRLANLNYDPERSRLPFDLCLHAMVSTVIGMITWWLERGMPHSPRHMALWLPQVNMLGMHYCLGVEGTAP